MQGRRSAIHRGSEASTRATLRGGLRTQHTPGALVKRARAMLRLAAGHRVAATARQADLRERHGRKWARRFVAPGIEGLSDQKRPGRPPVFSPAGRHVRGQAGL